jgi:hypothetical protein
LVKYSLISCFVIFGGARKVANAGKDSVADLAETNVSGIVGIHIRNARETRLNTMAKGSTKKGLLATNRWNINFIFYFHRSTMSQHNIQYNNHVSRLIQLSVDLLTVFDQWIHWYIVYVM